MPIISIKRTGKTVEAAEGSNLLVVLQQSGEPILNKCDSKAECDSCHIYITDGRKGVSKPQRAENSRLDAVIGVSTYSRLACQVIVGNENFTVEMPTL